jgi:DNA polymerase-3 subunit gamma/tau
VSTALYRRYRPETFDEVIGQEHVTDPLKAAIERGRINHAYLFSGPRGCGKTTSARILARCLNCEKGPTPVPCGECPSCRDLANGGPGSLDVVEIDAASHNGVDDARDLRERAIYAPARDRFKVFILDEAHMVTSQGFNALLKIVEEPPPHIKFVFATTEPEKVIGTIRSRTHHYPFRLVPPEALGNYLEELCAREGVQVAKGVLPLVVRAGGGSVRDTLSVLDQLIAGSGPDGVDYGRAIALLGYTPDSLLSDIVDAFSAGDGGGVYRAVERVIESGQDPRRFVEDLLERFRDLIVINAAPEAAHAFLPEVPPDRLERLTLQAAGFGQGELSRAADLLNVGLTEMSGATSPRLQLELICARILLPGSGRSRDAVLSRVERMERRIGMSATGVAANVPPAQTQEPAPQSPAAGAGQATDQAAGQGRSGGQGQSGQPGTQDQPGAQGRPSVQGQSGQPSPAADHDDFDDIAAMAVAAESMLNAPIPPQRPAKPEQPTEPEQPSTPEPEPESAHRSAPEPGNQEPGPNSQQAEPDVGQTSPESGLTRPEADLTRSDAGVAAASARPNDPADRGGQEPVQGRTAPEPARDRNAAEAPTEPSVSEPSGPRHAAPAPTAPEQAASEPAAPEQAASEPAAPAAASEESAPEAASVAGPGDIGGEIEAIRRAWPSILAAVEKRSRLTRAIIAANAIPQSFSDGTVYLGFNNAGSVQGFQQRDHAAKLAAAINDVLGIQARIDIGDVGRIGGNAPGGSQGKGSSGPAMNDGGNHGPAPTQRRPSPQEVAAVVGTREVDKPQVDHEKFWEPSGPTEGPWSSDDEEGDQPASPTPPPADTDSSDTAAVDTASTTDSEPAAPETVASETVAPEGHVADAETAGSDIYVPDLSDDDFFGPPTGDEPTSTGDGTAQTDAAQPGTEAQSGPADQSATPPAPTGVDDYAPMEYVEPRWDEPNWHDGPEPGSLNGGASDTDATSAGSGAVDVGAVVVPPPDDDLDSPDISSDFAAETSAPVVPSPPVHTPPPRNGNEAKPFKSRFAALAEKHGVHTTPPDPTGYGSSAPANGGGTTDTGAASAQRDNPYPQNSGSDEDEYDPETDLDVSEAPQVGVDVIARVLGGEIIDEREV